MADMEKVAAVDPNLIHIKAFDLPHQRNGSSSTPKLIALGRLLGDGLRRVIDLAGHGLSAALCRLQDMMHRIFTLSLLLGLAGGLAAESNCHDRLA